MQARTETAARLTKLVEYMKLAAHTKSGFRSMLRSREIKRGVGVSFDFLGSPPQRKSFTKTYSQIGLVQGDKIVFGFVEE